MGIFTSGTHYQLKALNLVWLHWPVIKTVNRHKTKIKCYLSQCYVLTKYQRAFLVSFDVIGEVYRQMAGLLPKLRRAMSEMEPDCSAVDSPKTAAKFMSLILKIFYIRAAIWRHRLLAARGMHGGSLFGQVTKRKILWREAGDRLSGTFFLAESWYKCVNKDWSPTLNDKEFESQLCMPYVSYKSVKYAVIYHEKYFAKKWNFAVGLSATICQTLVAAIIYLSPGTSWTFFAIGFYLLNRSCFSAVRDLQRLHVLLLRLSFYIVRQRRSISWEWPAVLC